MDKKRPALRVGSSAQGRFRPVREARSKVRSLAEYRKLTIPNARSYLQLLRGNRNQWRPTGRFLARAADLVGWQAEPISFQFRSSDLPEVVATLIYLAVQIRKNTQATRATNTQALTDSINNSNLVIAGDARLARLYRIGKFEGWDSLNEDEQFCWSYLATAVCHSLEAVLTHDRLKQADVQTVELAKDHGALSFAPAAPGRRRPVATQHVTGSLLPKAAD